MIKHERTNVYDFNFHLVWVTKYRKKIFIDAAKSNSLKEMLVGIARKHGIEMAHLEVMPDHVHMMISFPPSETPTSATYKI